MLIPLIYIDNFKQYIFDQDFFIDERFKIRNAVMDALNFFHLMFVDLFENLQNDANFVEILFISPSIRNLVMEACPILCQNYE